MRAVPLCDVVLDGVRVGEGDLIGRDGGGFGIAMRTLNAVRPIVAARGLGLAARVIMAATRHVETREAFGGPLAELQLVRGALAGLAARLEACRALTHRAAALVDADGPGKQHAAVLAAAKLLSTELAVDAATTCLHLAGAAGYTAELPFERALRDAHQLTIVEGTSEVQLELVARGLLDRSLWWDLA
jgi:alkylation response protein AidB-like acyl-CoA dehydrogenase